MSDASVIQREQRLIETFVELSHTLVEPFDLVDFLHTLAERCVELLDCTEVGLMLSDSGGALQAMAASSERTEALEILQVQNREGPCFDCYSVSEAVHCEDFSVTPSPWPSFVPVALQKGFHSVQAFPMRVGGQAIGAMNIFRTSRGRLASSDLLLGQGLADIAAIALTQERAVRESVTVIEQLQSALNSRVVIEQAKGVVAEQQNISVDTAFSRLRAHARANNLRLADIADEVIDGTLDPASFDDSEERIPPPGR